MAEPEDVKPETEENAPCKQATNRVPPPEEYRWKPGQSGNPKGRPKTPKLWEELQKLMESVDEGVHESQLEKGKKKSHAGWLAEAIVLNMAGGNAALVKDFFDRTLGKPKDTVEHTGSVGLTHSIAGLPHDETTINLLAELSERICASGDSITGDSGEGASQGEVESTPAPEPVEPQAD